MSTDETPSARFAADAALEIAQLETLVAAARIRLAELNRDVSDAESRLDSLQSVQLLKANEQLVIAAMRSQSDADTAAQALEEVVLTARLDALTGLPNRLVLLDRLAQAIPNAKRREKQLALLFLDLNHFKQINDTLGHAVGDRVLRQVADRMTGAVREGDTVSRLGGDEFVVLLAEVAQAADAALVADKLISALAVPMCMDDQVLRLTASIGVSLYPGDGEDASVLLNRADSAMYRAKRGDRRSVAFHENGWEADRQLNPRALSSMSAPFTGVELALAESERLTELLRETNEQLVMAVLDARDLQAAVEQAHARQTQLMARVAHELRFSPGLIRSTLALLGEAEKRPTPEMHALIEGKVAHLTRLVEDLSDELRVQNGKLSIALQRIDIIDVIDAAIGVSRPAMDNRMQALIVQVPSRALQLQGDPLRLTQVFSNLLDNASKYTPRGGEIRLSIDAVEKLLTVTVSDNGIGIAAANLSHVFEPFVQDPHAVGCDSAGLGIGLTVVLELVEAHHGSVVAHSAGVGQGSRFVVTLPLIPIGC